MISIGKLHRTSPVSLLALAALLAISLLLGGCEDDFKRVRIGSQDFTEQKILAEMMALLAEHAGVRVERAIPYGDNRKSLQAIQRGVLDAYPEYDGSLINLSGVPRVGDSQRATVAVRELVEPLGLAWLEPFGLDDGFALAVRRDMAIRGDITSISDLAALPGALSYAADKGYLVRPVDGLYALARRYGLSIGKVEVLPVGDRNKIYDALVDQHVDVAEVFMTDARLQDYGVLALEDDLDFYASYRPAPLVRQDALERFPKLAEVWNQLAGRISTDDMRRLNGRVERQGKDYRNVAQRHLEALGLLPEEPVVSEPRGTVVLAVTPLSDLGYLPIRAADAIREVMPTRRLQVTQHDLPAAAVRDGSARFGLLGAEDFYQIGPEGELIQARDIEADGAVGSRLAHVIANADRTDPRAWQRVATGAQGGSSWQAAWMLFDTLGLLDAVELVPIPDATRPAEQLAAGEVDALVVMAEQGHAGLVKLMEESDFALVDLADLDGTNLSLRYPFLRAARIPANTYPRQDQPLNTVSSQVVLATRVPPQKDLLRETGPGFVPGVFTRLPQRLPFDTALRLSKALGTPENVDPLLPASPGLSADTPPTKQRFTANVVSAVLNGLAVLFLVGMIVLFLRPLPKEPELRPEGLPPTD